MRTTCFGLLIFLLCAACSEQHDHKGWTPLVELDGNFLYREDLQSVLPAGLSKDDSLLFAEHYIRNWVEDILLYDKAQSNIPNNGEIDKLVENYRKALIMHTYQQALIHQRLSEEISEQDLTEYYEKNHNDTAYLEAQGSGEKPCEPREGHREGRGQRYGDGTSHTARRAKERPERCHRDGKRPRVVVRGQAQHPGVLRQVPAC